MPSRSQYRGASVEELLSRYLDAQLTGVKSHTTHSFPRLKKILILIHQLLSFTTSTICWKTFACPIYTYLFKFFETQFVRKLTLYRNKCITTKNVLPVQTLWNFLWNLIKPIKSFLYKIIQRNNRTEDRLQKTWNKSEFCYQKEHIYWLWEMTRLTRPKKWHALRTQKSTYNNRYK